LLNNVSISDDKWFGYLDKAGRLAKQMQGCENVLDEALTKYMFKVKEQASLAEDAINQTNIGQVSSGSMQQEEIKGGDYKTISLPSNLHERFADSLKTLYLAKDKAKDSKYDKISE
jgi:hypothetical protein